MHSGAEGRNAPLEHWLSLQEHACIIGGAVRWARYGEFPWWPALECFQSGPEIALRNYQEDAPTNTANTVRRGSGSGLRWYFFFGDEGYAWLPQNDPRYVVPFYQRSRESRIYAGKVSIKFDLICFVSD